MSARLVASAGRAVEALGRDLRGASRAMRRGPAFAAAAIPMLALGIAAWTLMFSILNGLILRPLPVTHEDRVLLAWRTDKLAGGTGLPFRESDIAPYARATHTFADVAMMFFGGAADGGILDGNQIVYLQSTDVSGNFFAMLGARPELGRALTTADDNIGAPAVVVISDRLWRRQFGGSPSVLGRLVRSNGAYHRIVGVMPSEFEIPRGADVWFPLSAVVTGRKSRADWPYLALVGRLSPGVPAAAARAEFDAYLAHASDHAPDYLPHAAGEYERLAQYVEGDTRPVVIAFTAASALLLLLACINVANLLVVRGAARRREVAVRTALGADRGTLVRQLVGESALLGVLAAGLGVALSWLALRAFIALAPPGVPRLADMRVDTTVLLAAVAATWGAVLIFGVGPAVWLSRGDLTQPLRAGSAAATDAPGTRHLKRGLVVTQVALAQVVLIGAGLLINSLVRLEHVDLGLQPEHVAFGRVSVGYEYANLAKYRTLFAAAIPMVRAIPGVVDVSVTQQAPLTASIGWRTAYEVESPGVAAGPSATEVGADAIGASYFRTLGIPLRRGREFTDTDLGSLRTVAIVSQQLADRAWPGRDPIGQRIRVPHDTIAKPDGWRTVIGVVRDDRYRDLTTSTPTLYVPYTQVDDIASYLLVRTRRRDAALRAEVLAAFTANGSDVWLPTLSTLSSVFAAPLARPRLDAAVLATFAAIALVLAAAGIYSLGAAFVRQRYRELGIRSALGARPWDLVQLVAGEGAVMAGLGILVGSAIGLAASRTLATLLFDVRPTDAATFAGVATFVALVAIVALAQPAGRAVGLNAATALKDP